MDWGVELWDQFENVDKHLHHGIEHTEKYMKFVQERSAIEQEYAKKLRRLVKSYMPKKKDDESSMFSTNKAFHSQLSEMNDIAGQHELVAENFLKNIAKTLHTFINELRAEKKKAYQEGKHLQSVLDAQERVLEQTKKRFEKEWKESERAYAFFQKLDTDPNVTKAEVDKARQASTAKKDSVESCKADYASALTKFNTDQQNHYQSQMPKVFENIRDMDERRIKKTSEVMVEFSKYDSDVKPIINKCLEGMKQAAEAVDANLDASLVVEKYKSGFLPPNDKEFEDYTSPQYGQSAGEDHANSPRNSMNVSKAANKKGLSWLFGGKKVVESADYSHLPPEQRKKKLQKHIDELRQNLAKETDGRNGIMKMKDVYVQNPSLGDASTLEVQIRQYDSSIAKIEADLHQYETWYADASGGAPPKSSINASRATSVASHSPNKAPYSQPLKTEEPETRKPEMKQQQSFADEFDDDVVGTCVALFDFVADSEGSMGMKEGDQFSIIEADKGDGWTRVIKDDMDGYVPTSYLEVKFY